MLKMVCFATALTLLAFAYYGYGMEYVRPVFPFVTFKAAAIFMAYFMLLSVPSWIRAQKELSALLGERNV